MYTCPLSKNVFTLLWALVHFYIQIGTGPQKPSVAGTGHSSVAHKNTVRTCPKWTDELTELLPWPKWITNTLKPPPEPTGPGDWPDSTRWEFWSQESDCWFKKRSKGQLDVSESERGPSQASCSIPLTLATTWRMCKCVCVWKRETWSLNRHRDWPRRTN